MSSVDNAIEYCICHCGVTDCFVPVQFGSCDVTMIDFATMAVFDDFRKVCAFLGVERHQKEIVEDQELRFSSFLSSVSIVPLFLAIFRVPISLDAFAYSTRIPALHASYPNAVAR